MNKYIWQIRLPITNIKVCKWCYKLSLFFYFSGFTIFVRFFVIIFQRTGFANKEGALMPTVKSNNFFETNSRQIH